MRKPAQEGDRITKKGLGILLGFVRQYWAFFLVGVVGLICIDATVLVMPKITGLVFDALANGTATKSYIIKASLIMVVIMAFGVSFRFVWRYCFMGVGNRINRDLRQKLFDHLEKMPPGFFDEHRVGDLTSHMTNDVMAVQHSVAFGMLAACDSIVMGSAIITLMFVAEPKLAALVLLPVPLIILIVRIIGRSIRRLFFDVQAAFSAMTEKAQEIFAGIMVVKAYGDETRSALDFSAEGKKYVDCNIRLVAKWALMGPMITGVSGISAALLLYFGGMRVAFGEMPIGVFTQFVMYLGMIAWPMVAISEVINHLERGCASSERIKMILDEDPVIVDGPEKLTGKTILEVKNLSYTYKGAVKPALNGLSFTVKEGETFGIVGRTGSGKTTLLELCLRLYNPPPGSIILNGRELSEYTLESLRGYFGYVPQEAFLFNMTIRDNIRFARPNMSDEEVEQSAKDARIHDEILKFKDGYETWVGERGVTLSGGQKQRVAIARALSLQPRILVLDDALSAVDAETESEILQMLSEKRKGMTNLIVAHRLSAVKDANHILVLNDGKVEAEGNHEELVKKSPYYQELYMLQSAILPASERKEQA